MWGACVWGVCMFGVYVCGVYACLDAEVFAFGAFAAKRRRSAR